MQQTCSLTSVRQVAYLSALSCIKLETVITRAAPAFHTLFMVMDACVFDINTVHKTVENLTFQAFY